MARSWASEPIAKSGSSGAAASATEIAHLISALDSNQYQIREEATQQLVSAGAAALEPLLAVANSDRPEPADRAIWILRSLGRSRDDELAIAAWEHLAQLKGRPALVTKAEAEIDERGLAACDHRLTSLGAEVSLRPEQVDPNTYANVLHVRLDSGWKGTPDDLRMIAKLARQPYFDLEGAAFDDAIAKTFESKLKLAFIKFSYSKVSPAGIDSLKLKHPEATVLLRNQAMLGLGGATHKFGVVVNNVAPGTAAAAAGILMGDVITTIDGQPVPDFDRLTVRIAQHRPNDKIDIEILRNEKKTRVSVTLGSWQTQGR